MHQPLNVTDRLRGAGFLVGDDENPEDSVYEVVENGETYLVKVKAWHDKAAGGLGRQVIRLTGAMVGPDGKALRAPVTDAPLVSEFEVQVVAMTEAVGVDETTLIRDVETSRMGVATSTVRAFRLRNVVDVVPGVGVLAPAAAPPAPFIMA